MLFLCSGNYYRSRYAEALFNHFARAAGWPWRAFSRGLSTHLIDGDISPHTRQVLLRRGIALRQTAPGRRPLSRADLAAAAHIVALKESEHRPIMRARFPKHAARVEYWKVHDLDASLPAATLAHIEKEVLQLAKRLLVSPDRTVKSRTTSSPRGSDRKLNLPSAPPRRRQTARALSAAV